MNKGFVVLAQDSRNSATYQTCAETLAISIRKCMPNANISIITNNVCDSLLWDKIIKLPYGDLATDNDWKLINDWQVYEASPYDYTIKLEADMYIPRSIDYWWDILKPHDLVVSTNIRNFKQEISDVRFYRKFIDDNKLPDVYNAITYFKKSEKAERFFNIVRDIFENWELYKFIMKCNSDEIATTDFVYAIACHIMGVENTTLPTFTDMSMVHMKQYVNELMTDDWTDNLVYEVLPHTLRINGYPQLYPFHYHIKSFSNDLMHEMEKWKK